jgi:hypothetical protein
MSMLNAHTVSNGALMITSCLERNGTERRRGNIDGSVEPPPVDYAMFTDEDELPVDTPSWRLKTAASAQLRSIVKRQREGK